MAESDDLLPDVPHEAPHEDHLPRESEVDRFDETGVFEPVAEPAPTAPPPDARTSAVIRTGRVKLTGLLDEHYELQRTPEKARGDEFRRAERTLRERIQVEFWRVALAALARATSGKGDALVFDGEDEVLLNFGWVDGRAVPREALKVETSRDEEEYALRSFVGHLRALDEVYLLVHERRRLAEALAGTREKLEKLDEAIRSLIRQRNALEAERVPELERERLAGLDRTIEEGFITLVVLERAKRSRGLSAERMRGYSKLRVSVDDARTRREKTLRRVGEAGAPIAELDTKVLECKKMTVNLLERGDKLGKALADMEREREQRSTTRRAELERRLLEIKEDMTLCGRWGRTVSSPVLLSPRPLNTRKELVEAIRVIEDFDPGLFHNRKVEREGKPGIVLTPGTGLGSYDFRSNALVVPMTSPSTAIESVAFALALYRKDVDQSADEGKLWKSFIEDIPWAKTRRGIPRGLQGQIRAFVASYVRWCTREARGMAALEAEIRAWFEERIAPRAVAPIIPRHLRGLAASQRGTLIEKLEATDLDGRGAYELGVLHFEHGDLPAALRWFEKAADLSPQMHESHWGIGVLLALPQEQTGLSIPRREALDRAREAFGSVIRLAEQSWWTRKAQDHLREVQARLDGLRLGETTGRFRRPKAEPPPDDAPGASEDA